MATKKSGKGGRAKAGRAASPRRGRTTKPAPKKKAAGAAKRASAAKKPVAAQKPAAKKAAAATRALAKPTRAAAKPVAESAEVTTLKARFQRERTTLEKRLTEAVREIGVLRHHELRAGHLENQLRERDETIARLQRQLAEAESRPAEPVYERELQQSFVLTTPTGEVDELSDDPLAEDDPA